MTITSKVLLAAVLIFLGLPELWGTSIAPQGESQAVSFCDLVRHPDQYNGKTLIIRAMYGVGMEFGIFFDDACKQSAEGQDVIAAAKFSEDIAHSSGSLYRKLGKVVKESGDSEAQVRILALFTDGKARVFGHQMCCRYELQVQRIISVDKVQKQPSGKR